MSYFDSAPPTDYVGPLRLHKPPPDMPTTASSYKGDGTPGEEYPLKGAVAGRPGAIPDGAITEQWNRAAYPNRERAIQYLHAVWFLYNVTLFALTVVETSKSFGDDNNHLFGTTGGSNAAGVRTTIDVTTWMVLFAVATGLNLVAVVGLTCQWRFVLPINQRSRQAFPMPKYQIRFAVVLFVVQALPLAGLIWLNYSSGDMYASDFSKRLNAFFMPQWGAFFWYMFGPVLEYRATSTKALIQQAVDMISADK